MQWLEGINAVTVIFAALCVFAIGYRFYGLYIAQKVLTLPRLQRPVPCSDRCLPRSSGTCPGFSGF